MSEVEHTRSEGGVTLADDGSFVPADGPSDAGNPLAFPDYEDDLARARDASGADEAVVSGSATIGGRAVELAVFEFGFMGGSMGEVAGGRITRALERAADRRVPFVLRTATGGARMQEGMRALAQMPRLAAARLALAEAHQPFVAVLDDPTTGGVLAGIAALADVTIAIAGATIGFAGPRVVESFTGTRLEPDSHTAESAFARGLVDAVVDAGDAAAAVGRVLEVLAQDAASPARAEAPDEGRDQGPADAWTAVEMARSPDRPRAPELLGEMADVAFELRGDRAGNDDAAVRAVLVRLAGRRALGLALDRDHYPKPPAYRKARRCIDLAGRLALPIVTLIDTKGADPSEGSEAGGIAWEIAKTFEALLCAPVPVVSIVTGEGGSGGALAFAAADSLLMLSDSIFSVIAPEQAAQILWRDSSRGPEAARLLKPTARDLVSLGVADRVVPGPLAASSLREALVSELDALAAQDLDYPAARIERWKRREP